MDGRTGASTDSYKRTTGNSGADEATEGRETNAFLNVVGQVLQSHACTRSDIDPSSDTAFYNVSLTLERVRAAGREFLIRQERKRYCTYRV